MRTRFPLAALFVALFVACGSSEDDPLFQPTAATCVENQTIKCACVGGKESVQTCLNTGKYGPCQCGSAGAGGATSAGGAAGSTSGGTTSAGGSTTTGGSTSGGTTSAGGSTTTGGSTSAGGAGGSTSGGKAGSTSTGGKAGSTSTGGAGGKGNCAAGDCDGDGYPAPLDCNDDDAAINPGAVDLPELDDTGALAATQVDNDCSGTPELASPTACDEGLGPIAATPFDAARAMGLCAVNVPPETAPPSEWRWGVIDAKWSDVAGPSLQTPPKASPLTPSLDTGIVPTFGPGTTPREGTRMFALSTGTARAPGQDGAAMGVCEIGTASEDKKTDSGSPGSFVNQISCGTAGSANDGIALDLKIRVPSNATSFTVSYRFFSCEFPQYTCSSFNDVFAIMMSPSPFTPGDPMAPDVAFESLTGGNKRVIGVNNTTFLTACKPGTPMYTACAGDAELAGTGFEGHAASGWLRTTVPVKPGSVIDLRFAIWDSSDGLLTSTAVVDGFSWGTSLDFGTVIQPPDSLGGGGAAGSAGGTAFGAGGGAGAAGDPFGGLGGGAGSGGSTGTAGAGGSTSFACGDGTCSAPGECCKTEGQPCGQEISGFCF